MNCELARDQFHLFLYGELSFDEEEALEQHLDVCKACTEALERERALHEKLLDECLEPSAALLSRCRQQLRSEIVAVKPQERQAWRQWLRTLVFPAPVLKFAGAAALVAFGFFGARLVNSSSPGAFSGNLAGVRIEPTASRVRYVEPDADGRLQIVVDETKQRVISGRLEDDAIRRLVLAAARDSSDPGLRAESVEILKSSGDQAEVRQALLYALQHDSNPGVRLKALEGLKPFTADLDARKVLARVLLSDDNPGVRTQAIDLLVKYKQPDVAGVLQQLLRKEPNNYVRQLSEKTLREMNASIETF
jgi:HEAT repeat protein/putative zinc finger protein